MTAGAQMICVGMRVEDPAGAKAARADVVDDRVYRVRSSACRCGVVVEHRVDDRRAPALRCMHDIRECAAVRVKERTNRWLQRNVHRALPMTALRLPGT